MTEHSKQMDKKIKLITLKTTLLLKLQDFTTDVEKNLILENESPLHREYEHIKPIQNFIKHLTTKIKSLETIHLKTIEPQKEQTKNKTLEEIATN
jgi:hypothetical protein